MKNVLKQAGKALLYLLLFVGMQAVVGVVISAGYGAVRGAQLGQQLQAEAQAEGRTLTMEELSLKISEIATEEVTNFVYENAILLAVVADVLAVLIVWLFFVIRKKKFANEVNIRRIDNQLYPWLVLLGASLAFVVLGVLSLLPEEVMEEYGEASSMLVTTPSFLSILAEAVLVPVCEEIFFRGLIFSRLKKAMPVVWALVISAALFGIVHGTNPVWFGYAFALGCVFAFTVYKTGSIVSTMILHMIFNLLGGTVLPMVLEFIPDVVFYVAALLALACVVFVLGKLSKLKQPECHKLS